MKTALLLSLLSTAACRAPLPPEAVLQRERDLAVALVRRDSSTLAGVLAADFPAAVPEHVRAGVTRGMWITVMVHRFDLDTVGVGEVTLASAGDTARARFWMYWRGRVAGQPLADSLYLEDTWVQRRRAWRLLGREVLDCRPPRDVC